MQLTRNGEYCIAGAAPKHAVNGHCWRSPSTDWAVGGPIIERAGINLLELGGAWVARASTDGIWSGETPLIAAMRAYVASVLGDEVPDV